jgi:proteasome accessory factor A
VLQTPRGAVYCLSRWAAQLGNALAAARSRPLISTRDEPRAAAAGRRLRVLISDSTMSETTTLLKAGATDLVLRLAEAAAIMPDLTLDNPVQAVGAVSRDITGRTRLRLASGRAMTRPRPAPRSGLIHSGQPSRHYHAADAWASW